MDQNPEEKQENDEQKQENFSKNSIIVLARRAGIKSISQCGIDMINFLMNEKINQLCEKIYTFHRSNNNKTITKKIINDFFESEGIHITHSI